MSETKETPPMRSRHQAAAPELRSTREQVLGGLAKECLTEEMASGRGAVDLLRWRVPRLEVLSSRGGRWTTRGTSQEAVALTPGERLGSRE